MACPSSGKIDANTVGFNVAEEECLKDLGLNPAWQAREANSFDDFGGELSMVARRPFSASRQRKKGSITDLDADGGFNEDLTQNNMQSMLQGFFFASLRKTAEQVAFGEDFTETFTVVEATDLVVIAAHGLKNGDGPFRVSNSGGALPAGLLAATDYWAIFVDAGNIKLAESYADAIAGTAVNITDAGTGTQTITRPSYALAASDTFAMNNPDHVVAGSLLVSSGWANAANNGMFVVSSVVDSLVAVSGALVDEAVPPVGAKLKVVGYQFDTGSVEMTVGAGFARLNRASGSDDYTALGLIPGQWIFVGGDTTTNRFNEVSPGYARIALDGVKAASITFDKTTFAAQAGVATGKEIRIYFGDVLKNEDDPDLIARRSYQFERTLGKDADGTQAEYLEGAVASELTWNSPLSDKVSLDLSYVALDHTRRKGIDGPKSKDAGATLTKALGEDAFNTSSNVFRLRMNMVDPTTLTPTPLFARVTEWTMTINNNVSAAKAQGTLGGFDTIVGNFDVGGDITAYFSTVAAIEAVRENADVTFDAIYSKRNAAVIMDIPLLGLGGGRLEVEQDQAIMVPLENSAAESSFGHTLLLTWLPYVPNAGVA